MKKENFVSLILGTVGGVLFALGMCMCLLEEWNSFSQGLVVGGIGLVILIAMLFVRRKMLGKPAIRITAKSAGIAVLTIAGALAFGIGLCMTMVWEGMMVWGIIVGLVGMILLICLIPVYKGIR